MFSSLADQRFHHCGQPAHARRVVARPEQEGAPGTPRARFELPKIPPFADDQIYNHSAPAYEAGPLSRKNSIRVLNASAMFACTRWTNLWFPCRYGVFGDPFGGALRPHFGKGVLDLPSPGRSEVAFHSGAAACVVLACQNRTPKAAAPSPSFATLSILGSATWLRDAANGPVQDTNPTNYKSRCHSAFRLVPRQIMGPTERVRPAQNGRFRRQDVDDMNEPNGSDGLRPAYCELAGRRPNGTDR